MFRYRCPLRWSDLDAQGHVNNALLLDYLQDARVAFLQSSAAADLLSSGIVVAKHQVEYRQAIEYEPGEVEVELGVAKLGGARIELGYRVRQRNVVVANARTVLCPFDFVQQRPVRLTAPQRAFFSAHQINYEPLRELQQTQLRGRGTVVDLLVRWTDLDSYGHVNNAVLFDYLQQARITATTQWAPEMARVGVEGSTQRWLVARQDADYLAQISHRAEPYQVAVAPIKIGRTSITLSSEMRSRDLVLARASTVLVAASEDGPVPLSERTRGQLLAHLVG